MRNQNYEAHPLITTTTSGLTTDHGTAELEDVRAVAAGCETEIKNAIYQCPFVETAEVETWSHEARYLMTTDPDIV